MTHNPFMKFFSGKPKSLYHPGPGHNDLSKIPDSPTYTRFTSRECAIIEESNQRAVAENPEWLLAKSNRDGDSRKILVGLGFVILGEQDLFYRVQAPKGWTKVTEGFWTTVLDDKGNARLSQFYKGAFYDRRAHIDVLEEPAQK